MQKNSGLGCLSEAWLVLETFSRLLFPQNLRSGVMSSKAIIAANAVCHKMTMVTTPALNLYTAGTRH